MRTRAELEAEVEAHLAEYIRVGLALRELRGRRLYEEVGCPDFQAYLHSKHWGMSWQRAYQFIDAAGVAEAVSTIVEAPQPANEGQARALVPVKDDPVALEAVWTEVTEAATPEAPLTAARIRAVVRRYRPTGNPGKGHPPAPDEADLTAFYGADRRAYRDVYTRTLAHLAFLQREAAALERRFRRRALQPSELADVGRLVAFLQSAVDALDTARKHRLPLPEHPPEVARGDADVG
jgi:hypothetical protein